MALNIFELFGEIVIRTQNAKDEIDGIVGSAENLSKKLGTVSGQADNTGKKIGSNSTLGAGAVWLGNMFTTLTSKAASLIGSISKTGFDYNAQMETYITAFTTMLGGNALEAEAFIEKIRDLASKTPMEMTGLAGNAQTLLGFGLASESVIDTLQMLGDVAQGDQQKLDSIVLAYSQIMAAQKLNAQDANQLINAGVPIWNMLAEQIGATVGEVRKMSEDGAVSAEDVTNAFQSATSEGGLFYQAMARQAETFNGQLSTLKDNADQTVGSLFQPFFDIAKSDVLPEITQSLTTFGEWITNNKESISEFATTVGGIVTTGLNAALEAFKWIVENDESLGPILWTIAGAFVAIQIATNPVATIIAGISAALVALAANWDTVSTSIETAIEKLKTFLGLNNGIGVHVSESGTTHGGGAGKGFANGLSRVPYDNFPALLHKDETVLNRADAREYRFAQASGGMNADVSRLEAMMGNMVSLMQQMVANTAAGQNIVLDSGALVGSITPSIDRHLGVIASRKGRG